MDENNFPITSREELTTAIKNAQQKTSNTIFNKTLSSINVNLVESLTEKNIKHQTMKPRCLKTFSTNAL